MKKKPEKIYKVFISSTYKDLKKEREEVIEILLGLNDYKPVAMEYFPASTANQWTAIKENLDECDFCITIVAGKYGTIDKTTNKSYTHMEYEYACENNIPIISFVYNNIENLPISKCETKENRKKKLEEFKEIIYNSKLVKEWKDTTDLTNAIAPSLNKLVKDYPTAGYIKASEVEKLEKKNKRLEDKINKLEKENSKEKNGEVRIKKALKELKNEYKIKYNFKGEKEERKEEISLTLKDIFLFLAFELKEGCDEKSVYEKIAELIKNKNKYDKKVHLVREEYIKILMKFKNIDLVEEESKRTRRGNVENFWSLTTLGNDVYTKLESK